MLINKFDCLLGNNLFQYAFARIVAEELEFALDYDVPNPNLDWKGHPSRLDTLQEYFPNSPLRLPGKKFDEPFEYIRVYHTIDFKGLISNKTPRKILLQGFFQRMEYFEPYKEKIHGWFRMKKRRMPYSKNDILLVVRRGDDFTPWYIPLYYYDQAIESMSNVGNVYIVGTDLNDEVVKSHFLKYKPTYFDGPPIKCFEFIGFFNRVILANSTFSWWATFLSDAEEIIAPRSPHPDVYAYTGFQDVDLHMRESRYKEFIIDKTSTV